MTVWHKHQSPGFYKYMPACVAYTWSLLLRLMGGNHFCL
jgi:hypothetical protein